MGYYREAKVLPVKDCGHVYHMTYLDDRCWCDACGQTWSRNTDSGNGSWKPLSLRQASHGEIKYG